MGFDPTSTLKDWGLTFGLLGIIATIAFVVFIFSFREFATWFLRVNKILENQKALDKRLDTLEKMLAEHEISKRETSASTSSETKSKITLAGEKPPSDIFKATLQ